MAVNWTNVSNPIMLLAVPNENTNGSFWTVVIFMVWSVLLLIFIVINFETALLTATFIALIASIILTYAGLVAWWVVLFFAGTLLFAILYIVWSSNRSSY
jgi:cell division protein FtsW (lipid II flippase)